METQKAKTNIYVKIGLSVLALILILWVWPWGYNDPTERTVVTTQGGSQKAVFEPGIYWAGFFSKEVVWPNQISVSYKDTSAANSSMEDNTIEIGQISVRFNDATTAKIAGITQYILPATEKEMLEIHNAHRTPEALVKRRIAPYTQECLQSSAQLMSSEMHYSGGRAQMVQDYLDQLKNGAFLLKISTINSYDSLEKASKKIYEVVIQTDKNGQFKRKFSSIKEYAITVGDAQITDVDYQTQVDNMLAKKIDAATAASISKQQLMTAQQQALTAKAQGEKKLVETEYAKKVDQTNQVVAAETKVKLAEQYKFEQKMAAEAAMYAAQKIKTEAEAEAYKNRQLVSAGLSPWDKADFEMQTKIKVAEALSKISLPSTYIVGGQNGNTQSLIDALLSTKLIDSK
jgi:hypothetical protein